MAEAVAAWTARISGDGRALMAAHRPIRLWHDRGSRSHAGVAGPERESAAWQVGDGLKRRSRAPRSVPRSANTSGLHLAAACELSRGAPSQISTARIAGVNAASTEFGCTSEEVGTMATSVQCRDVIFNSSSQLVRQAARAIPSARTRNDEATGPREKAQPASRPYVKLPPTRGISIFPATIRQIIEIEDGADRRKPYSGTFELYPTTSVSKPCDLTP